MCGLLRCGGGWTVIVNLTGSTPHKQQPGLGELAAYLPRPDAGEEGDGPGGSGKGKARARKPPVSLPPLPAGRGCHLVILAVPPHMVPGELLQFVSPFREVNPCMLACLSVP